MHEVSIVNSIIKTIESEFEQKKLEKMKSIHLKVGVLSNIEPSLLYNAYNAYNYEDSKYHKVQLNIKVTDIKIQCEQCNSITEVKNYKFMCKQCNLPCKNIIQGEEMLIHKIEFED